jgi:16S rRNA G966 N2-methylase RsmD
MTETQDKNIAWFLPRPKPDRYKGGMPLHCEDWLLSLAKQVIHKADASILNLFCGMNKHGFRVDLNPEVEPDIVCDAHELTQHLNGAKFDIILADPPYSNEEARELYGTPKLNYKKWTKEAEKVLNPGGLLIVYHKYIMPNPNPDIFHVEKRVFIGNRTYHIPRVAIYFKKEGE